MTRLASLLFALLLATPASAQPETAAPEPVTLDVQASEVVDPEALRAALEADLGVEVRLVQGEAARVIVTLDESGRLTLRVRRADGDVLERATDPDRGPGGTVTTVSLLVANLVRDESGELLALLRIERAPPVEPEPPTPPIVVVVAPPEPPAEPAPEPSPAPALEPELDFVPAAIDFLPFVGFSSAGQGRDRRHLALGVLGALSGRVEGLSLSGVLDLALGEVRGLQLAGVAAIATDRVRGVQLAFVGITGGRVEGLQLTGIASIAAGALDGVQLSMINVARPVRGVQLGAVNVATADALLGVEGLQLGLVNVSGGVTRGVQLGMTNVAAGDVEGVQLGLVNIGDRVHGMQLGLVNVARTADLSLGLVNIQHGGHSQLRVGVDTNGYLGATLVHGSGVGRWLLHAAGNPFLAERPGALAGVGIGFRIEPADILHIDIEAAQSIVLDRSLSQRPPDLISDVRLVIGVEVFEGFGIFGGLGYRIHYTPDRSDDVELGAPFGESVLAANGDTLIRGWPTIQAGVELF